MGSEVQATSPLTRRTQQGTHCLDSRIAVRCARRLRSCDGGFRKKAQHEWGQVLPSTLTYSRLDVSFAEPPVQFRITT
jgi:hypothetical protein